MKGNYTFPKTKVLILAIISVLVVSAGFVYITFYSYGSKAAPPNYECKPGTACLNDKTCGVKGKCQMKKGSKYGSCVCKGTVTPTKSIYLTPTPIKITPYQCPAGKSCYSTEDCQPYGICSRGYCTCYSIPSQSPKITPYQCPAGKSCYSDADCQPYGRCQWSINSERGMCSCIR